MLFRKDESRVFRKTEISPYEEAERFVCTSGMVFHEALDFQVSRQQINYIIGADIVYKTTALSVSMLIQLMSLLPLDMQTLLWRVFYTESVVVASKSVVVASSLIIHFFPYSDSKWRKSSFTFYQVFCYGNTSPILCTEFLKQWEGIGVFCCYFL